MKDTETKEVGRPTRYRDEYCDLIDKYLLEEALDSYNEMGLEVSLPTIGGYLIYLNAYIKDNLSEGEEYKPIWESTIYDWRKANPLFSESLEKIVKEQEKRLINAGLSGRYNSTIAKLILSANHGYTEKTARDITSNGEKVTGFNVIFQSFEDDEPQESDNQ